MRYRAVSVREDVYELLVRLSIVGNMSMSDLIRQLVTAYLAMSEIKEMLRRCLNQLGTSESKVDVGSKAATTEPLIEFEGNPWVRIIRARVVNGEGREGH